MKKLLSIMACIAMVLVGGLTLMGCGGKTTDASYKEFMDYLDKDGTVTEFKTGYTLSEKTVVDLKDAQNHNDYKGNTQTNGGVLADSAEKKVTEASYEVKSDMTTKEYGKTSSEKIDKGFYYKGEKSYTRLGSKKTFKDDTAFASYTDPSSLPGLLQGGLGTDATSAAPAKIYLGDQKAVYKLAIGSGFDKTTNPEEATLKDGAKFTKNVNGDKLSFKLVMEIDDYTIMGAKGKATSTIEIVYNKDELSEYSQKAILKSEKGKYESSTVLKAATKISLPKDLNKYTDMNEYRSISFASSAATFEEKSFQNSNYGISLKKEFLGNGTYKITGTGTKVTEANKEVVKDATDDTMYVVVTVGLKKDDVLKYVGPKGVEITEEKVAEETSSKDIVLIVGSSKKATVTVQNGTETFTITFDFSELKAPAKAA